MKMKICQIGLLSTILLIALPCFAFAQNHYVIGVRANQSSIEADAVALMDLSPNPAVLTLGADGVYDSEDFNFVGLRALMGSEMLTKGLIGKLGFKTVFGTVQRRGPDSSLVTFGFTAAASYDLAKAFPNYIVPFTVSTSLTFSPQPTCFNDTKEFTEFTADVAWNMMSNAAIDVGYRYLDMQFDSPAHWTKVDNSGFIGFKFFFR